MSGKNEKFIHKLFVHFDFIIVEAFILILSFLSSVYLVKVFLGTKISPELFRHEIVYLILSFILSLMFTEPYRHILARDKWRELNRLIAHTGFLIVTNVIILYIQHEPDSLSRSVFFLTWIVFVFFEYLFRVLWKRHLRISIRHYNAANHAIIILCRSEDALTTISGLSAKSYTFDTIRGIFFSDFDKSKNIEVVSDIQVLGGIDDMYDYSIHNWVDDVYINLNDDISMRSKVTAHFDNMGIAVHHIILSIPKAERGRPDPYISQYGNYIIASYEQREIHQRQWLFKRMLDISGGIIGCIICLFLIIILGPFIFIKSPGSIIFKQQRVGRNGKVFKFYKIRSMYMDAENRKAELLKRNKMEGQMFKVDDDPRIIGSERKDKNGRPAGIGNFIRNTSIDEFPQFFNVLKGDMSLVGTRPPTVDEWRHYSEHHRKRLSMRPGITGIWQISGRNNITDFEEIVKLDEQYIDNWTVGMDIKILWTTIKSVLKKEGAS